MPAKILLISDCGYPSGYGRIADEVAIRLVQRGHQVHAASFLYDGMLPARLDFKATLPYHVSSLRDRADWTERCKALVESIYPDIVMVVQDATHLEAAYHSGIDWSAHSYIGITPVDGVPISPNWVKLMGDIDAGMTISEFGVEAYKQAGVAVSLCRPGVDPNVFYELPPTERIQLREKVGLPLDAFIVGTFAMNQHRKLFPDMLDSFFQFAVDKPNAYYYLDMREGGGWNIADLCKQQGWDEGRLLYQHQVIEALPEMRERLNLLNVQMVISEREGYGLPLVEGMACGVVAMAQDYCSGREITGGGERGLLVRCDPRSTWSGWGGAKNRYPDIQHMVDMLNLVYTDTGKRLELKTAGMEWARSHTWDSTADQVEHVVKSVMLRREQQQKVAAPPVDDDPLPPLPPPPAAAEYAPPPPRPGTDDPHPSAVAEELPPVVPFGNMLAMPEVQFTSAGKITYYDGHYWLQENPVAPGSKLTLEEAIGLGWKVDTDE